MIGSWNVNGKVIRGNLDAWLIESLFLQPDIFVVGFQELDLSAENLILGLKWWIFLCTIVTIECDESTIYNAKL